MTKLHLDVDGVVNANIPMRGGWPDQEEGIAVSGGYPWKIRWSPSMVTALSELGLDLVWTTTWKDDAVTAIAPLIGWGEEGSVMYPVKDTTYMPRRDPSIVWKFEAMQRMYSEGENTEPFVWIDDEISWSMIEWATRAGGLAIPANPFTGITTSDIDNIKEYLAEQQ